MLMHSNAVFCDIWRLADMVVRPDSDGLLAATLHVHFNMISDSGANDAGQ